MTKSLNSLKTIWGTCLQSCSVVIGLYIVRSIVLSRKVRPRLQRLCERGHNLLIPIRVILGATVLMMKDQGAQIVGRHALRSEKRVIVKECAVPLACMSLVSS